MMDILGFLTREVEKGLGRKLDGTEKVALKHVSSLHEIDIKDTLKEEAVEFISALKQVYKERGDV